MKTPMLLCVAVILLILYCTPRADEHDFYGQQLRAIKRNQDRQLQYEIMDKEQKIIDQNQQLQQKLELQQWRAIPPNVNQYPDMYRGIFILKGE
jgi:hypothetical protein